MVGVIYVSNIPQKDGRKNLEIKYNLLNLPQSVLQSGIAEWGNKSDNFKNAFYETSSLNEQQVKEMLTYGSGPKVLIEDLTVIKNAHFLRNSMYLQIMFNWLFKYLFIFRIKRLLAVL